MLATPFPPYFTVYPQNNKANYVLAYHHQTATTSKCCSFWHGNL